MMARTALGALVLMTMACAPVRPPASEEEQVLERDGIGLACKADAAKSLIGQPASSKAGAEALRLTRTQVLRWIRPGDAVSQDYRTDRLNIHLDGRDRIQRIDCG